MTSAARVLIVEDDLALREALASALENCGYDVCAKADGRQIEVVAETFRPDLGVLDVRLAIGPDGFELGEQLRRHADMPLLFLTAADALEDRLRGFSVGADDYLVKPFALAELLARVHAVLRRSGRLSSPTREIRDLVVDEAHRVAMRGGVPLDLTATEFELLSTLARSPGRVLSKGQLLSLVWGFDEYDVNVVEVHVSALRRKMDAWGPRLLHTIRGAGYVLGP